MSEDFPLPDTPVTATKSPSGIATLTFCKLLQVAPSILMKLPFPGRRTFGMGIYFLSAK